MLAVGFSCMCFIRLENFSFSSSFWEYHVCVLNFDRCFFYMHWDDFSLLYFVNVICYIDWLMLKLNLHFWSKLCFVMMYHSFYIVLDSIFCFIFTSTLMRKSNLWFSTLVSSILLWCQVLFSLGAFISIYISNIKVNILYTVETEQREGKKKHSTTESHHMTKEEGKRKRKEKRNYKTTTKKNY